MTIEEEIAKAIYKGYASNSGVLFGIPSDYRKAVETIIKLAINKTFTEKQIQDAINKSYEHYSFNQLMFWTYLKE